MIQRAGSEAIFRSFIRASFSPCRSSPPPERTLLFLADIDECTYYIIPAEGVSNRGAAGSASGGTGGK